MGGSDPAVRNAHIQNTSTFALAICAVSWIIKIITAVLGKTSLQMIDCFRSGVELVMVFVWWRAFTFRRESFTAEKQERLNSITRVCMIVSAALMSVFAILRFIVGGAQPGILWAGFAFSLIGVIDNLIVAVRYRKKAGEMDSLRIQSRFFFVKAAADACVCLTLLIMMISPDWDGIRILQLVSSILLSAAMMAAGLLRSNGI